MDYRGKLIQLVEHVRGQEVQHLNGSVLSGPEMSASGDYDHWTLKDTLAHLSEWRLIAAEKLAALAAGETVSFHEDLDSVNRRNYAKHRHDSAAEVGRFVAASYDSFQKKVMAFNERDLLEQTGPLGFGAPLWRYILVDGFLHPTLHLALYHFEQADFGAAFRLLAENYQVLSELDDSPETARSYFDCEGLLDEPMERPVFLRKLQEFRAANANRPVIREELLELFVAVNGLD